MRYSQIIALISPEAALSLAEQPSLSPAEIEERRIGLRAMRDAAAARIAAERLDAWRARYFVKMGDAPDKATPANLPVSAKGPTPAQEPQPQPSGQPPSQPPAPPADAPTGPAKRSNVSLLPTLIPHTSAWIKIAKRSAHG